MVFVVASGDGHEDADSSEHDKRTGDSARRRQPLMPGGGRNQSER
ncbi:hypothetical protein [Nocardia seriolae]